MSNVEKTECTLCEKIGFKPFTRENVFYYYVPVSSLISYAGLAINVMNPPLASRLVPKKDLTNILLTCTLFGTTLYFYSRPHLKAVTPGKRIAYSVMGSVLFGLGSVLLWAIIRSGIPRNNGLSTVLGLASGAAIVKLGNDYMEECDKTVKKN